MKTLVIHPKDGSTSFLDIVYNPIKDKTLVTGGISKNELKDLIKKHDRIMMMGHGSPSGLFSVGQFTESNGFIIDHSMVPLLEKKSDNVYIWCNADQFVTRYKLKGFFSGMFISEVGEANYCGLPGTPQSVVDESNYGFCNIISNYISKNTNTIYENVRKEYGIIAETNKIAKYNHQRLYMN